MKVLLISSLVLNQIMHACLCIPLDANFVSLTRSGSEQDEDTADCFHNIFFIFSWCVGRHVEGKLVE